MQRLVLTLAAASLSLLAACGATLSTAPPDVVIAPIETVEPSRAVATGEKVVIGATQALIVAANAHQGAVAIVKPFVKSGKLTRSQLDVIEAADRRILFLLERGDVGQSVAARAAEILNLVPRLRAAVGR